jgi:hypothetical protein
MAALQNFPLVPAQAGTQRWIPACAGMSAIERIPATRLRPGYAVIARSEATKQSSAGAQNLFHRFK